MLRSRGHEVFEYTRDNNEINLQAPHKIAFRTLWSSNDYGGVRQLIRREKVDLVHVHNFLPLISPSVFYAAQQEHVPVVHTLHNYRLACPGARFLRNGKICEDCLGKTMAWPGILHGCYRKSRAATTGVAGMIATHRLLGTWTNKVNAYLVVSEFMRRKFATAGLPPEKIFLKPNFAPDRGAGEGHGGYALFVGRLEPEKGITTLLAAWEQLGSKVPLKIVGSGPLESFVTSKVATLRGVEFLGSRPFEQVFQLMGDALALVVPSQWYEGAPRVIVEALSRGTPVIASDLGGMAELVQHEHSGILFPPGDAAALALSVLRVLEDPQFASQVRTNARNKFLAEFTEERNYQLLMSIYSTLTSARVVGSGNEV
ncbi:MAG: glycosyltransferase [Terriglobia bacterium]|nr:glycosyltransferase [Terriglobia bacterium]